MSPAPGAGSPGAAPHGAVLFDFDGTVMQQGGGRADEIICAEVRPDQKQAYARAEIWRPYRAVATHLLWAWYTGVKRGEIVLEPVAP